VTVVRAPQAGGKISQSSLCHKPTPERESSRGPLTRTEGPRAGGYRAVGRPRFSMGAFGIRLRRQLRPKRRAVTAVPPGVRTNLPLIMNRVRIFHDFNTLEGDPPYEGGVHQTVRAPLVCRGTADDLARLGIELHDGMLVTLYEPEVDNDGNPDCLEVDAVIRRDRSGGYWVGEFDFAELCYASENRKI
jgi:hypothetical protein